MNRIVYTALLLVCAVAATGSPTQQSPTLPSTTVSPSLSTHLVGKPAIRWVIPKRNWTNTQQAVWLGGLQGHITIIEFFRINCSHCEAAAPSRRALYSKYQKQGLKMIGFQSPANTHEPDNTENNWNHVKRTVADWQLPYPIAFDKDRVMFDKYGLNLFPTILVLDKKGIVRFQQVGYTPEKAEQLDQFLAQLFKTSP